MDNLTKYIQEVTPEIQRFRRDMHSNPEPAFEEYHTSAKVAKRLQEIPGIILRANVAKTGLVAILGADKKGPCVGLRADMDCLRMQEGNTFEYASKRDGLMHACGHDGHTAMLLGAALVLGRVQDALQGPVKFLFQPAEENEGGAKVMIDAGVLHSPPVEAIFGLHVTTALPLNHIGFRRGALMAASRYFTITIHGKGCHAASPHRGIDPVLIGSQIICSLQSIVSRNINPLESGLISIPKFTGSTAPNVIPEKVELQGTLRAISNKNRELLEHRLRQMVESTAVAHGGSANIEYYGGYPLLENDDESVAYLHNTASKLMVEETICDDFPPSMGAEDFAFYLQEVPGAFFWLGLNPEGAPAPSLHHPRFDFNDAAIPAGIRLHCEIARNFAIR